MKLCINITCVNGITTIEDVIKYEIVSDYTCDTRMSEMIQITRILSSPNDGMQCIVCGDINVNDKVTFIGADTATTKYIILISKDTPYVLDVKRKEEKSHD